MADVIPNFYMTQQANGVINFSTDNIKCILCSGSYVEATLRDLRYYYELSGSEIGSGYGYTVSGIDVSGTSAYTDDSNDKTIYTCSGISFSATSGSLGPVRYAVLYDIDAQDTLVYFFDFSESKTILEGSNLEIRTDPTGFMKAKQYSG